ncbi:hypothetical protein D3C77_610290 [compost metagenome]
MLLRYGKSLKRLPRPFDRQQLGSFFTRAHELLARDDGAVIGNRQVAHTVHLLRQHLFAQQCAVALHQHQAWLHGIQVHLYATFGLGTNAAIGDHQGFAVWHP